MSSPLSKRSYEDLLGSHLVENGSGKEGRRRRVSCTFHECDSLPVMPYANVESTLRDLPRIEQNETFRLKSAEEAPFRRRSFCANEGMNYQPDGAMGGSSSRSWQENQQILFYESVMVQSEGRPEQVIAALHQYPAKSPSAALWVCCVIQAWTGNSRQRQAVLRCQGQQVVIREMTSYETNESVVLKGMSVLLLLLRELEHRGSSSNLSDSIRLLILRALKRFPASSNLFQISVKCLQVILRSNSSCSSSVIAELVKRAVATMQHLAYDSSAQMAGLCFLADCSSLLDTDSPLNLSVLAVCCKVSMGLHHFNVDIQKKAIEVLMLWIRQQGVSGSILSGGELVNHLVRSMCVHTNDAVILEGGSSLLLELCNDNQSRGPIISDAIGTTSTATFVSHLERSLIRHVDDVSVAEKLVELLCVLVAQEPEASLPVLGTLRSLNTLVIAIRAHAKDRFFQHFAIKLVLNIARAENTANEGLCSLGAVKAVVNTLSSHKNDEFICTMCCSALGVLVECNRGVAATQEIHELKDLLFHVLKRFPRSSLEIIEKICGQAQILLPFPLLASEEEVFLSDCSEVSSITNETKYFDEAFFAEDENEYAPIPAVICFKVQNDAPPTEHSRENSSQTAGVWNPDNGRDNHNYSLINPSGPATQWDAIPDHNASLPHVTPLILA